MAHLNQPRLTPLLLLLALTAILASGAGKAQALEPLVETGDSPLAADGKHVSVHVPGFFSMVLDTRGPNKGIRMTQSVMLGLVRVDMDRERVGENKFRGPIRVSVGGMTMYDNKEPSLDSSSDKLLQPDNGNSASAQVNKI